MNPIVGEMYAYMQRYYDKQPMRASALTDKAYMDEVTKGNAEVLRDVPHDT